MRYDIDPMIMMKSHPHEGIPTYYDENGIKKEEAPMVDGKLNGMVMATMKTDRSRWKPPMWMAKSMARRFGTTRMVLSGE